MADLAQLEALCDVVKHTSLCGLGQSAPNPILSTRCYFRDEYRAYIEDKIYPVGVCSMQTVKEMTALTIDGHDVSARSDQTVLDVARENGIPIPTLCHLDGLSDVGACRLCLIEMAGSPRLQPACITHVGEGMQVTTRSERLDRYRKTILELLFSERNHICSVCVSNGHCDFQHSAQQVGLSHVQFPYLYPKLPLDDSHDRFVIDHNRCILCTRCVRVCDEIEGAHT